MSVRAAVVVAAGGSGRRLGGVRKQYLELAGEPLLLHALRPFLATAEVDWVVVALPADDPEPPAWLAALDTRIHTVAGGAERGDSVRAGLEAVPEEAHVVLVHDAARPLVTVTVIQRAIVQAAKGVGAIVAVPVADTIKVVADGVIIETADRRLLWQAQTPQAFPRAMIVDAYRRAAADGLAATDDAALVERYGGRVVVVEGERSNLKVTRESDIAVAEALLRERAEGA
jgi:2-C-methyl-D-erythritol 4-phosphate cytidylyltransferase